LFAELFTLRDDFHEPRVQVGVLHLLLTKLACQPRDSFNSFASTEIQELDALRLVFEMVVNFEQEPAHRFPYLSNVHHSPP
jgi:hypothetical protein